MNCCKRLVIVHADLGVHGVDIKQDVIDAMH